MIFFLYLLAVFISLFILYAVARHDFVLLRQSISLRQVFDNMFLMLIAFFVFARITYIFYSQNLSLFNPLRFFYLTKYWGITPYLGFAGVILSLILLYRKKKNKLRILDIYFVSYSPVILLDVILKSNSGILLPIKLISLLVLISFYGWFVKIHNKFTTKDGFISVMTIITYSLVTLALSLASNGIFTQKYLWFNACIIIITLVSFVTLILIQKDTFNKK